MIGILYGLAFHSVPAGRSDIDRFRVGIGNLICQAARKPLVEQELERIVIAAADAAVIISRVDVWIGRARRRITRTWCQRHVVIAANIQPAATGADIINRHRRGVVQLLRDSEVPLHRVRVLGIRIHVPLHLLGGCGSRECAAPRGERILRFHDRCRL